MEVDEACSRIGLCLSAEIVLNDYIHYNHRLIEIMNDYNNIIHRRRLCYLIEIKILFSVKYIL